MNSYYRCRLKFWKQAKGYLIIGGVSMATITNALNIAATVAEVFSLGGAIAYGLDIVDGKFDGYLWT